MSRLIDNYDLWKEHQKDQEGALEHYPVCDGCGNRITDADLYEIFGQLYCIDCMNSCRHPTEQYMEDYGDAIF